mmetsp:Transcript_21068/g.66531  ORF Transcript_21068/g.66531 Transcript_21068/m.66531 type:complete len:238 (-) Transcript_21068:446-1159(-)
MGLSPAALARGGQAGVGVPHPAPATPHQVALPSGGAPRGRQTLRRAAAPRGRVRRTPRRGLPAPLGVVAPEPAPERARGGRVALVADEPCVLRLVGRQPAEDQHRDGRDHRAPGRGEPEVRELRGLAGRALGAHAQAAQERGASVCGDGPAHVVAAHEERGEGGFHAPRGHVADAHHPGHPPPLVDDADEGGGDDDPDLVRHPEPDVGTPVHHDVQHVDKSVEECRHDEPLPIRPAL